MVLLGDNREAGPPDYRYTWDKRRAQKLIDKTGHFSQSFISASQGLE